MHKAFGKGIISEIDGSYFTVAFEKVGEKIFTNPDAFVAGYVKKAFK